MRKHKQKTDVNYYPSPLKKQYSLNNPMKIYDSVYANPYDCQNTGNANYGEVAKGQQQEQNTMMQAKKQTFLDGMLITYDNKRLQEKSGIFILKNQSYLIYSMPILNRTQEQKNKLKIVTKKSYIIHPDGISVSASFSAAKKLEGWMIGKVGNKFLHCHYFKKGSREGEQYYYDFNQKLLVVSEYQKNKLKNISKGVVGDLQKLLKGLEELLERINQLMQKNYDFPSISSPSTQKHCFEKVVGMAISGKKFNFYGELIRESYFATNKNRQSVRTNTNDNLVLVPHGYGLLMSQNDEEMYLGYFNEGMLSGLGSIKFTNGDLFYGQLKNGVCSGYSSVTSGLSKKHVCKFSNQEIQKQEFEEFLKHQFSAEVNKNWLSETPQSKEEAQGAIFSEMINFYQILLESYKISEASPSEEYSQKQYSKLSPKQENGSERSYLHIQVEGDNKSQSLTGKETPKIGSPVPKLNLIGVDRKSDDNTATANKQYRIGSQQFNKQTERQSPQIVLTERQKKDLRSNIFQVKIKKHTHRNQHQQNIQKAATFNSNPQSLSRNKNKNNDSKNNKNNKEKEEFYHINQLYEKRMKAPNKQAIVSNREEYLGCEQLGKNDPWYVTNETHVGDPRLLNTKPKFKLMNTYDQNQYQFFQKGDRPANVNYGKIRKVGSDVSDSGQENFVEKIKKC